MAEREYRRLTRTRVRQQGLLTAFQLRSSLWLGKDHVLCVDSSGYTEEYKRFYFRNIQAIIIRRTERWKIWAYVLCVPAALCALVALASREPVVNWIFGVLGSIFVAALLIDLALGPTCVSQLRTAVQTEELPSLNRVRRAHKALARLRPLIAEVQGQLAPEEIPARMQELLAGGAANAATSPTTPRVVVDDPNAPPRMVS